MKLLKSATTLLAACVALSACGPSQDDRKAALEDVQAWVSSEPALKDLEAELPPPKFPQDFVDLNGRLNVSTEEEFLQAMGMVHDKDLSDYGMHLKTHVYGRVGTTWLGWRGVYPPDEQKVQNMLEFVDEVAQEAWIGEGGTFVRNPSADAEAAQEYVVRAAELVDKHAPGTVVFKGFDPELHISAVGASEGLSLIRNCIDPLNAIRATSVTLGGDFQSIDLEGPLDEAELTGLKACTADRLHHEGTSVKLTTPDGEVARAVLGGQRPEEVKSDTERRFREIMEG